MRVLLLLLLSGCVSTSDIRPYGEYVHIDPTPFQRGTNDAYDLFCGGGVYGYHLSIDIAACKSLRNDMMYKATIRYTK